MTRFTKKEFAAKESISVSVLNSWIYRYGLPVIQIGRRIYITDEDFAAWWGSHKKVVQQERPIRLQEMALPTKLRKSTVASKMRPIY